MITLSSRCALLAAFLAPVACSSSSSPSSGDASAGGGSPSSGGASGSGGTHASGGSSGTGGTKGTGGKGDAAVPDSGKADAAEAGASICPSGLDCVAPTGVYICEKPGPLLPTCTKNADCTFGQCYALSGQGICLALCTPPEGEPDSTTFTGKVVEFEAGKGFAATTDPPAGTPIAGADVCIEEPATLVGRVPCVKTDATGEFVLAGLPPNRTITAPVAAGVSIKKAGYLSFLTALSLGAGSQSASQQFRLFTTAQGQALATKFGTPLPDSKTGWVLFGGAKVNADGATRKSTWSTGGLDLITLDQLTATMKPLSGVGPIYATVDESLGAAGDAGADAATDAGLAATSTSGWGLFMGVADGSYTMTFAHPTLNCGMPGPFTARAGYVFDSVTALCGAGVP